MITSIYSKIKILVYLINSRCRPKIVDGSSSLSVMNNVVVKDYHVSAKFMILSGLNSYLSVFRIIYFSHFIVWIQFYLDV